MSIIAPFPLYPSVCAGVMPGAAVATLQPRGEKQESMGTKHHHTKESRAKRQEGLGKCPLPGLLLTGTIHVRII